MDSDVPLVGDDQRSYLSRQIDAAVEGHLTDDLLGMLVRQALDLRYYSSDKKYLVGLIDTEVQKYAQKIIAEWLKEHDDEIVAAVMERLSDLHVKPMAEAITDEFIEEYAKGKR